ncbi:oligosaccharide flippase family protein [Rhodococcus hoagii]|nr:oligosaccharide flippase family protein [Prescottella equi]
MHAHASISSAAKWPAGHDDRGTEGCDRRPSWRVVRARIDRGAGRVIHDRRSTGTDSGYVRGHDRARAAVEPRGLGLVAIVASLVAFGELARDFGLSTAAAREKNLTKAQQSNLFWINTVLAACWRRSPTPSDHS